MVITGGSGEIELANSRTDALFGYSRQALIGRNIRDLIPEWEPTPELVPLTPLTERKLAAVRRDGSTFPSRITRSPFQSSGVPLITTAIRDATEQVEAEERIRKANAELEKRVAERTAALSYSNEALRQFAWAASHDLQEPIRTVLSYAQWLASADPEADQESRSRMLTVIQDHASRLYELLGALRQYIQVSELGSTDSENASLRLVDCNTVLNQVTANLHKLIEESGATVEWAVLPTVWGTEILLVQLFQNLIANGIKHRSTRPPVIRVQAKRSEGGWIFSVQDNGAGIDPKYSDYIFGVFRRLNRGGGAGMGLAICRAVVERLGGRIWVEPSAPGTGSTFCFSVPQRIE
jgi:PAS domain S-box-containing protein